MEDKNPPSPERNERISRRFFDLVINLVKELEDEQDFDGLDALPTVMITTGVMAMCRTEGIETVSSVLDTLRNKVECGDFSFTAD